VVSDALREALPRYLPGCDIHLLHNAVPVEAAAHVHATNGGPVRVVYLGHFLKLKGIYDLVEAIPKIRAQAPDIKFLLCGLHQVEQVRELCQRRGAMPVIERLGPISFAERWTVLRNADIFVLPSYEEGLPVTVLEAMAVGLPIIATPVGGIPQVVKDEVNGFLIQPGDIEALVERVLRLAKDPALRQRMGKSNQARITEEFDAAPFVKKLANHLRDLTETSVVRVGALEQALPPSPINQRGGFDRDSEKVLSSEFNL